MNCEYCQVKHDGKYGSGRFCSSKCSRSFSSNKNKDGKNSKISKSLIGRFLGIENSFYKNSEKKQKIGICPICKNEFNGSINRTYCSRKCYFLDDDFQFRPKVPGGYRKGSGIGKSGWYKGFWCDSSWELAFVIYNIDNNILFKRNKDSFQYNYEGRDYKYYPDFIMSDGSFVEIKGYETKKEILKYKSINKDLKILKKKEILPILNWVIEKHGKDFINLYE